MFKPGKDHHRYNHGHRLKDYTSPTYTSWQSMISRCSDPGNKVYFGRVSVCERWSDFTSFLEDMGERPKGTTIDRIDGTLGYEPGNCRWATSKQQAENRITTKRVMFFGELRLLSSLAKEYGIPTTTIYRRSNQGLRDYDLVCKENRNKFRTGEDAPSSKLDKDKVLIIKEQILSGVNVHEIAKSFGVSSTAIYDIKAGRTWRHINFDGGSK